MYGAFVTTRTKNKTRLHHNKKINSFAQDNAIRGKASRLRLCKWRVPKYYVKKRILRHGNKVNEIKYFNILTHHDICKTIIKNNEKLSSIMSNLQTHYHFKLDFQKVDQQTGSKWLIHGTKHREDIQLQTMELPC